MFIYCELHSFIFHFHNMFYGGCVCALLKQCVICFMFIFVFYSQGTPVFTHPKCHKVIALDKKFILNGVNCTYAMSCKRTIHRKQCTSNYSSPLTLFFFCHKSVYLCCIPLQSNGRWLQERKRERAREIDAMKVTE